MEVRAPSGVWPSLLLGLACLVASPASAQHGMVAPPDRPLHERLAAAEIVAFATVVRVDADRIAFEAPTVLRGALAEGFEVKRSPSKSPPWVAGDRALLLLAGARSPYVWLDRPAEVVTLDAGAEARWHQALVDLAPVAGDAFARRSLYARWCDGEDEDLAAVGLRGLSDLSSLAATIDADFSLERAQVASDEARSLAVRRRAARVAVKNPAGVEVLVARLTAGGPDVDRQLAELVLQAALLTRRPDLEAAIVWALADPTTEVGELALRLASRASTPAVERRLSELAVGHPDAAVRDDATHALKRLRRNNLPRGG